MMVRKNKKSGGTDPNAWMVTFSDLLTLLLTFFVLLLTMSSLDNKRLKETFGFFSGRGPEASKEAMDFKPSSSAQTTYMDIKKYFIKQLIVTSELDREYSRTEPMPTIEGDEEDIDIAVDDRGLVVTFKGQLLFDSGKAKIKPGMQDTLVRFAGLIQDFSVSVVVEGHTDDRPIHTERFPSNWELSVARSTAVARFLTERGGLDPKRVSAAGYGKYRPIVTNDSPKHRAKNRRVEVIMEFISEANTKALSISESM